MQSWASEHSWPFIVGWLADHETVVRRLSQGEEQLQPGERSPSNRTQRSSPGGRSSAARNHAGREVLTNAGMSALTAAVAASVLLGRSTARRDHKVLGVPVPTKID